MENPSRSTRRTSPAIETFLLCVFGLVAGATSCLLASDAAYSLAPASRLWLEGDSTLHPYSAKATKLVVTFAFEPASEAGPASELAALRAGAVRNLVLTVPVDGLSSGEAGLDKNLRKALKSATAPTIRFILSDYSVDPAAETVVAHARGRLSVAGVEKDVTVSGTCDVAANGLHVVGTTDLLMSDFGIKPPTMMLGAIRTADKVVVRFDLVFTPSPSTTLAQ
ncbi:MAG: YceI family protein [Thermoanaerobaculia bacterium]